MIYEQIIWIAHNKRIYSDKVLNLSIVDVRKKLLYTYLVKNVRI